MYRLCELVRKPIDSDGERDLIDEIDADLREILANHRPEPLADHARKQIDAILKKYGVS